MKFEDQYSFLSNMYSCKVHYDGETFPCVETAFQYAKCANDDDQEKFMCRGYWINGYTARQIGQQVKLRDDWNEERLSVMYELLEDKFYHNERLREALRKTGNIYIQEDNTWNDKFWGVCNGEGMNMLGKMLMEIREEIQKMDNPTKKVIVVCDPSYSDYDRMKERLDYYFMLIKPVIVSPLHGLVSRYAKEKNIEHIICNPKEHNPEAEYLNNVEMAKISDCLIVFGFETKQIRHLMEIMRELDKPIRCIKR